MARRRGVFAQGGGLRVRTVLGCAVWCAALTLPGVALPQEVEPAGPPRDPSPRGEQSSPPRPSRLAPRAAFDACEGKQEGDSCTFSSREDVLHGECALGSQNDFACRPYRGIPPRDAPRPAPGDEPREGRGPTEAAPAVEVKEKGRGTAASKSVPPGPSPEHPRPEGKGDRAGMLPVEKAPAVSPAPGTTRSGPALWTGLAVSLAAAALAGACVAWWAFFRRSTVPLRRLRNVTQQLAGGNLSARVGEGLVRRRNEVADLGRDVDRMAERIESLLGAQHRLIRDVSHELRSPLSRLNVALELARQSAGPSHAAPFDRIERESDRLNELISQLLTLTKLESESTTTKRALVDLTALVAEVAQDADFEAKRNDRRVSTTAAEPLRLHGDQELLRQALENLVRNAARYTAPGTTVEISLRKVAARDHERAHLEVRDQGPGVPEAELADIFRPFYRVNDARDRQSGGAGVGLAISDRAVRLHGGTLRALNAPGGGLVMEVELPLG